MGCGSRDSSAGEAGWGAFPRMAVPEKRDGVRFREWRCRRSRMGCASSAFADFCAAAHLVLFRRPWNLHRHPYPGSTALESTSPPLFRFDGLVIYIGAPRPVSTALESTSPPLSRFDGLDCANKKREAYTSLSLTFSANVLISP